MLALVLAILGTILLTTCDAEEQLSSKNTWKRCGTLTNQSSACLYGQVTIHNECDFDIIVNTVTADSNDSYRKIAKNTSLDSPFICPSTGGVSLKLGRPSADSNLAGQPITQLEYTVNTTQRVLYYDISNVDCGPQSQSIKQPCPFFDSGMYLTVSDCPSCTPVVCSGGVAHCDQVYNLPNDDKVAMRAFSFTKRERNLEFFACHD